MRPTARAAAGTVFGMGASAEVTGVIAVDGTVTADTIRIAAPAS